MEILKAIITNVLTALYQPFWFAVILSVLFMFVYKAYPSIKQAAKDWISWFKSDPSFRRTFFLVFYCDDFVLDITEPQHVVESSE